MYQKGNRTDAGRSDADRSGSPFQGVRGSDESEASLRPHSVRTMCLRPGLGASHDAVRHFSSASDFKADEACEEQTGGEDRFLLSGGRSYPDDTKPGHGACDGVAGDSEKREG